MLLIKQNACLGIKISLHDDLVLAQEMDWAIETKFWKEKR